MKCHECQEWLHRKLDGDGATASVALERHLAHCPVCRGRHQAALLLLDGLHALKRPAPPPGLTQRIVASVLADRQARRIRLRLRLATTLALAASLLFAALAGYIWLPKPKPTAPDMAGKRIEPRPQPDVVVDSPSLAKSVEEAREAVASLTEKIADKSKEQARLWWPAASIDLAGALPVSKLEQPLAPAAQSLRHTGQGVSEGLQTVAQSARRALSYFVRELPPLEKSGS
jgi:hypothetical protein